MKFVYGRGGRTEEQQCIPNSVSHSYTITFSFICNLWAWGFFLEMMFDLRLNRSNTLQSWRQERIRQNSRRKGVLLIYLYPTTYWVSKVLHKSFVVAGTWFALYTWHELAPSLTLLSLMKGNGLCISKSKFCFLEYLWCQKFFLFFICHRDHLVQTNWNVHPYLSVY